MTENVALRLIWTLHIFFSFWNEIIYFVGKIENTMGNSYSGIGRLGKEFLKLCWINILVVEWDEESLKQNSKLLFRTELKINRWVLLERKRNWQFYWIIPLLFALCRRWWAACRIFFLKGRTILSISSERGYHSFCRELASL